MDRRNVNGQMNPAAQISQAESEQINAIVAGVKELVAAMKKADKNNLKRVRRLGEHLNDLKKVFEAGRLAYRGRILKKGDWKAFVQSLGVSEWQAKDSRRICAHWDEVKDCLSIREALESLEAEDSSEMENHEPEDSGGRAPRYEESDTRPDGEEEEEEFAEESRPKSANSSPAGRQKQPEQASKAGKSRAKPEKSTSRGGEKTSDRLSLVEVFQELRSRPKREQLAAVRELFEDDDLLIWLNELWAKVKKLGQ